MDDEPEFVRRCTSGEAGFMRWYATTNPNGFDPDAPWDWAVCDDPYRLGPFDTEEEAHAALDAYLNDQGIDTDGMLLAAKHAQESLEADKEYFPGNELAKRRFQVACKAFANVAGNGNPPAEVVGLAAASLFVCLCGAYPSAGAEIFRRVGNLFRQSLEIPQMPYGEVTRYDDT